MKLKAFFWTNKVYCNILWKNSKFYFFLRLLDIVAMNISRIFYLYFLKGFIDAITEKTDFRLAIGYLVLYFVVSISTNQIVEWTRVYLKNIQMKAQIDMQQMVIKKSFTFDLDVFENPDFYDTFTRAYQYASGSSAGIISLISGIISDVIGLSAVVYIVAKLNIWVFLLLISLVILDLAVNMHRDNIMDKLKRRLTRVRRKQSYISSLLNKKASFKDLKISGAEEFILDKMYKVLLRCKNEAMNVEVKTSLHKIPVRTLELIFVIVTYYFIGRDLFRGAITIGDFNMTYNATYSIKAYLITIGSSISGLRKEGISALYFYDFFMYKGEKNGKKLLNDNQNISIEFKNVYFKYTDSQDWVLKDVSFVVNPGETVLLVGENGAGKTTIINLLLRLYYPNKGTILVNGIPLEDYDITEIYKMIAVVFQDHQEYAFSIAENVLLKDDNEVKETSAEEKLQDMLGSIRFKKLSELPKGIFTCLTRELDDDGMDLSGGERQKLAIARAFGKKAHFFILDEPSSALDPLSEEIVYENLKELTKGYGAIIISHHLSNSIYADRILVVEKGCIIENGSHQVLIEKNGTYAKLYNLQMKKFVSIKE